MKKLFALLLALVMLFSLTALFSGCEGEAPETQPPETEPEATEPPRGNRVGDLCYGFQLEIADENGATGETIDPTATGKITIINFWGTWCNPCVNELPHLEDIAENYSQDVTVIAVHSQQDKRSMVKFISENYPGSAMIFAYDQDVEEGYNGQYYTLLEATGFYPYSLVLDENGVIVHIFDGAVSYEDVQTVVEAAGAQAD